MSILSSPGRIRTCGQSITRILKFLKGVDYIIIQNLDARRFASLRSLLPFGIVSEPSTDCSEAWLLIPFTITWSGFQQFTLFFDPSYDREAAN